MNISLIQVKCVLRIIYTFGFIVEELERTTAAGLTATAVSGGASEPTEASKTATASKPNGLATEAILFGSLYEDGEDENNILDEVDHSQVSHSQERGLRVQV